MSKIDGIEFNASLELLMDAARQDTLPEPLVGPYQALIKHILEVSDSKPYVIYLFSTDKAHRVRDYFAHSLCRVLGRQVPSAVIVDCDFTATGMSGIVPQNDALGFLDYLLYGSSLGVVTQEATQGVRVIGAGSFPVSKKMPVSTDSMLDAARRLASQCRIVILCGPARDDEENIHPIADAADLLMNVSYEARFPAGRVDPFEEELAARCNRPVISVRIASPAEAPDAMRTPVREDAGESVSRLEEEVPAAPHRERMEAGKDGTARWMEEEAPRKAAFSGLPYERKQSGSIWAKIIPAVIAVGLIGFLFWWFIITKPVQQTGEEPRLAAVDTAQTAGEPPASTRSAGRDTVIAESVGGEEAVLEAARPAPGQQVQETSPETAGGAAQEESDLPASRLQETGAPTGEDRTAETERPAEMNEGSAGAAAGEERTGSERQAGVTTAKRITTDDVHVAVDFSEYSGKYLVHISSFRELERAKEDAVYLLRHNFAAFVIPVDLGSKGRWYRVYVGPLETRDDARQQKIMLDELPRVKFTRIAQAPGF